MGVSENRGPSLNNRILIMRTPKYGPLISETPISIGFMEGDPNPTFALNPCSNLAPNPLNPKPPALL